MVSKWFRNFNSFNDSMQIFFQESVNWLQSRCKIFEMISFALAIACNLAAILLTAFLSLVLSKLFERSLLPMLPLAIVGFGFLVSCGINMPRYYNKYTKEELEKVDYLNNEIRRIGAIFFLVGLLIFFVDHWNKFMLTVSLAAFFFLAGSYFAACERNSYATKEKNREYSIQK